MSEADHYHANLQRGSLLLDQDQPEEALPFLQAAIAANPNAALGYAELARCWNEMPTQRHKAIDAINRAISLEPYASYFYGRKGWFLICSGQFRAAKVAADEGLAIEPACITSLNALANAYTKLGQWSKAEEACLRILSLDPFDAPAFNLLAQALRHQGKFKESRKIVARLLARMPNNPFGHANAGYAALAAGDYLRANEHFLESLRMDPDCDLARRGLIESLKARIWIVRLRRFLQYPGGRYIFIGGIFAFFFGLGHLCEMLDFIYPQLGRMVFASVFVAVFVLVYGSVLVLWIVTFLLLFDPIGRHALKPREKVKACLPIGGAAIVVLGLAFWHQWFAALGVAFVFGLLMFSVQYPLLRDRWQRRREEAANS